MLTEGKTKSVVKKQCEATKPSAPPAPRKDKMDEKTANEMIEKIGSWLADGAPGATKKCVYETVPADLARKFPEHLLEDARADGRCGSERIMLSKREKWLIEQAYDAGREDTELWYLINKPADAAPLCAVWLAEPEATSGTVERYLDEEAPDE